MYLFGWVRSQLWQTGSLIFGMWDLVLWPGIKPSPPALGAWSLNHWKTREVLKGVDFKVMVNARCRWNVDGRRSYSGWKDNLSEEKGRGTLTPALPEAKERRSLGTHLPLYLTSFQKWRPLHVTDTLFRLNLNKAYTVLFQFTYINVSPKSSLFIIVQANLTLNPEFLMLLHPRLFIPHDPNITRMLQVRLL